MVRVLNLDVTLHTPSDTAPTDAPWGVVIRCEHFESHCVVPRGYFTTTPTDEQVVMAALRSMPANLTCAWHATGTTTLTTPGSCRN